MGVCPGMDFAGAMLLAGGVNKYKLNIIAL